MKIDATGLSPCRTISRETHRRAWVRPCQPTRDSRWMFARPNVQPSMATPSARRLKSRSSWRWSRDTRDALSRREISSTRSSRRQAGRRRYRVTDRRASLDNGAGQYATWRT